MWLPRLLAATLFFLLVSARLGADGAVNAPLKSTMEQQRDSLAAQRESIKHQAGADLSSDSFQSEFFSSLPPPADYDCAALTRSEVATLIASAAKQYAVSSALIRAVMKQESAFKPCAVSYKGAQGLMQLMPATAALLGVNDPFDPQQNVRAGTAFLKRLLDRYKGDLRLTLVAYNAGSLKADQLDPARYPLETQAYLANILSDLGLKPNDSDIGLAQPSPDPAPEQSETPTSEPPAQAN